MFHVIYRSGNLPLYSVCAYLFLSIHVLENHLNGVDGTNERAKIKKGREKEKKIVFNPNIY